MALPSSGPPCFFPYTVCIFLTYPCCRDLPGIMQPACAQSCPTLCDPTDYSLPGSSVHRISQARILERVAISFSRGSSWPRDPTRISWASCIGRWVAALAKYRNRVNSNNDNCRGRWKARHCLFITIQASCLWLHLFLFKLFLKLIKSFPLAFCSPSQFVHFWENWYIILAANSVVFIEC